MSLAGLMVALLLAAAATLGSHCTAAAETAAQLGHAADHGDGAPVAHSPAGQSTHGGAAGTALLWVADQSANRGGAVRMLLLPVAGQAAHRGGVARMLLLPVGDQAAHRGGTARMSLLSVADQAGRRGGAAWMALLPVSDQPAYRDGTRPPAHLPVADRTMYPGSPTDGSSGLVALCVSVAVAVLLALLRLGQPRAVEVRAPVSGRPAVIPPLTWPSPDPLRLCVLRT